MAAAAIEKASRAYGVRDLLVVYRVADQDEVVGLKVPYVCLGPVHLRRAVEVVRAAESGEIPVNPHALHGLVEEVLPEGGDDVLAEAKSLREAKRLDGVGREPGRARMVRIVVFLREGVPVLGLQVHADGRVEVAGGEREEPSVVLERDRRKRPPGEEVVERVDALPGVVKQRAVPVPEESHG